MKKPYRSSRIRRYGSAVEAIRTGISYFTPYDLRTYLLLHPK